MCEREDVGLTHVLGSASPSSHDLLYVSRHVSHTRSGVVAERSCRTSPSGEQSGFPFPVGGASVSNALSWSVSSLLGTRIFRFAEPAIHRDVRSEPCQAWEFVRDLLFNCSLHHDQQFHGTSCIEFEAYTRDYPRFVPFTGRCPRFFTQQKVTTMPVRSPGPPV
jgi:hypothetical protein